MLDEVLLRILACPQDKGPLYYFPDENLLYNPRLRCSYAIRQDIPIMLADEATQVDSPEHESLLALAEAKNISLNFQPGQDFKSVQEQS